MVVAVEELEHPEPKRSGLSHKLREHFVGNPRKICKKPLRD
jgi:hypothetical protein